MFSVLLAVMNTYGVLELTLTLGTKKGAGSDNNKCPHKGTQVDLKPTGRCEGEDGALDSVPY